MHHLYKFYRNLFTPRGDSEDSNGRSCFPLYLLIVKQYGLIKSQLSGGVLPNTFGSNLKQGGKYSEKNPVLDISFSIAI
jgi:hypothetical protein